MDIPAPPAYLAPIKIPVAQSEDDDPSELAVNRRHALEEANGRLSRGRAAWLKMKATITHK